MTPQELISEAADLAENLVEAISAPSQDWPAVERAALALAQIARQATAESSEP